MSYGNNKDNIYIYYWLFMHIHNSYVSFAYLQS